MLRKLKKRQPLGQCVKRSFSQGRGDIFRDIKEARCHRAPSLFRARFAARHVSRLGRLIFALLHRVSLAYHRVSLAYRQVSSVPHGAKSSKIARPILLGCVYRIYPFWYRLFIFLIIMPQPSPKIDRASGVRASRQKNDSISLLSFVCRCVAVLSEEFCAQTSLLCSALALRRGTSRRFEWLVWASLHHSERSRTIEVRVATLSAQTCTKSLTQSYLILSIEFLVISRAKPKK